MRDIVIDGLKLFCALLYGCARLHRAADLCWRELAIVAKALADGRDMTEIGLMRDIALRTIAVLRDAGRMEGAADAFCAAYSPKWGLAV